VRWHWQAGRLTAAMVKDSRYGYNIKTESLAFTPDVIGNQRREAQTATDFTGVKRTKIYTAA